MPGIGSDADCICGYHASCLMHGVAEALGLEQIVIAYAKDRPELVSIRITEAKRNGFEYIERYPSGDGYRCPVCGKNTLTFTHCGLHWD